MIELINISKRYKDKWVLNDIHMKLNEERCVGRCFKAEFRKSYV